MDTLRVSREDGSCCLVHEVRTHPPTQRLREATFSKNAISGHQAGRQSKANLEAQSWPSATTSITHLQTEDRTGSHEPAK